MSMSAMTNFLPNLTPREAVADALHRCVLGIDSQSHDLFASAILNDDSSSLVINPVTLNGWPAIDAAMTRAFAVVTTHFVTNIRVEVEEGAETAKMTANAIAYHVRPDEAFGKENTSYTAGCLYFMDLVRKEGLWRIKRWEIKTQWTTGDIKVLHPDGGL